MALLVIICLAFISLGLPDSMFGAAWTVMGRDVGAAMGAGGIVTSLISGFSIVSSLMTGRIFRRFSVGTVTAVSVGMTGLALLGFSQATAFWQLCLLAVPLGLGAGCVDAGLNAYVALHYGPGQMSMLHCFYGIGVTLSPYAMAAALAKTTWRGGYLATAGMQGVICLILVASLPLWRRGHTPAEETKERQPLSRLLRLPGAARTLFAFVGSCGMEYAAGIWASTYLVEARALDPGASAQCLGVYYAGMTLGRFASGLTARRLGSRRILLWGQLLVGAGVVLLLIPLPAWGGAAALFLIGFGNGPVFPNLLHLTPVRFDRGVAQGMMGLQMAASYLAITLLPPVAGLLLQNFPAWTYPVYLLALFFLMFLCTPKKA